MASATRQVRAVKTVKLVSTSESDNASTLTYGQEKDLSDTLKGIDNVSKVDYTKKVVNKENKMTPTNNEVKTKKVQKTVFDLTEFDNIKLVKEVELPKKPESIKEALEMLENNTEKLLAVIYDGLVSDTTEKAREDMTGFLVVNEEGKPGDSYSGQFADEAKGELINAAVLSLAKMQGYEKSLTPEKKRELKDKAREFLRSNPAMLASIQS